MKQSLRILRSAAPSAAARLTVTASQHSNRSYGRKSYTKYGLGGGVAALASAAIMMKEENEGDEESSPTDDSRGQFAVNTQMLQKINYQNRIRRYSTPDKVFRLFATIKVRHEGQEAGKGDIYMTADDFVRAITPGDMQPDGLGLDSYTVIKSHKLDKFLKKVTSKSNIKHDSVLGKISHGGLLNFSDYIFLLTVLGTSARHWAILFRVFDVNGDGDVDRDEFKQVMKLAQANTSAGDRHRDTGDSKQKDVCGKGSPISQYFFPNENSTLTVDDFLVFHAALKDDILRIQFNMEQPNSDDKVSKMSFAKMLLEYMDQFDTYEEMARVRKVLKDPYIPSKGVSFDQVRKLYRVLDNIDDIEMALDMHTSAGIELSKETFKHVAYVVSQEVIDDEVLEVMWAVFDQDGSGGLSNKEFLRSIKGRASFGLDKPKDTGLWRLFHSVAQCSKEKIVTAVVGKSA